MMLRFIRDETGATAIEYGLVASMFALLVVSSFNLLGVQYVGMYEKIVGIMTSANDS